MNEKLAEYLAIRIEKGKLNYNDVVEKYPECKEGIDTTLANDGYTINVDRKAVKEE